LGESFKLLLNSESLSMDIVTKNFIRHLGK
jgi:hypothetical protein